MSSVMKKLRKKRTRRDEFQITASVSSLVLECQKEKWHPCKLAIVWNKENPKLSSTEPVPWQGGFKNPYSGIIVWPEPDPVKTKLTLFKNSENALYQYQDKPWQILVQNVSPSGKRKVIAVGSLDISEYIMEEPTSHDITVTLKPVKKTVLSGSLEFTLSSVILEDGIPRRTDKEIFDEIMNDAIAELKRKKSLQKSKKSNGQGSKSSSQKTPGHKAPVSDTAACDPQEAAPCGHSNVAGLKKVESKAPSNPPPLHAASQSAPPEPLPSQPSPSSHCDVKEVNSSLSQSEEKTSNKKADKYPKKFDAFGDKQPGDRKISLKSENASDLCKETTMKDVKLSDGECVKKNLDQANRNNILTKNSDASFSRNDSRDDDQGTSVPLKTPLVQNETVRKKAKRRFHFARKKLKRAKGKESSKPKEGDDGHGSTPRQAPSLSNSLSNGETRPIPSADASPSRKGAPFNQEELGTTEHEASTTGVGAGSQTVVHSVVREPGDVMKDVESSNPILKTQHESETVSLIGHHCPELSVYIREETFLLQHEITSLERVIAKLEQEIQEADETKACEDELEGLTQDYVRVNQCRSELITKKRDLEIMSREGNLEECITGMRQELTFLFELEDWRKTDQHKAREQKLLDVLVSLARKIEFNNCSTGLKF